ncbi:8-oxo-dGTP pyrophosphatase MutT (NUDIX family) [Deinobacterium chartae]|uniref:8-oxo-dGTP pyrophosphatase MutT (NUDIX family) n=1 Tax=Deinobacterium chartae TaxID=521158 RepID=A0A841I007_9DEIO|nr:CoA pyrophosphatase [Deinobacterium chartae]MBB6098446.1 8-oxo-dGTP pyrophosphatase MutT (NUDIX family) [Deinobacterium chartae]
MKDALDDALSDELGAWLRRRERLTLELPQFRRAAVLVGLTRERDPKVLLTVRSSELPSHKGQIAFPGGSLEPGESVREAALREALEEVGLLPATVSIIGEMDDTFTPVGFHVTPVLARIPAHSDYASSDEVAEILEVPLSELRALQPRRTERVGPDGRRYDIYAYPWRGYNIWGMTARILHSLLNPDLGPLDY